MEVVKVNEKEREYVNTPIRIDSPRAVLAMLVTDEGEVITGVRCDRDRLFVHLEEGHTKIHNFQTYPNKS